MGRIKEDNILTKYLRYTEDNEAPELYHKWSLLTVLGHVFKKNVKLNMGYFTLYPGQLYVFLVGPPAVKKSTAIRIATSFLNGFPDVHVTSGKLSTQALIDSLESHPVINGSMVTKSDSITFIKAPELANFIPRASYMEEIIPFLTDAYDAEVGEWRYATRARGEVILNNILLTWMGGSTPDWLFDNIPENAWGGGFMSRVLLIHQPNSDRINPLPQMYPWMERIKKEIQTEMLWMANNLNGDFVWTKEGKEWYDKWYRDYKTHQPKNLVTAMAHYHARKSVNLLKIAMTVAIIQTRSLVLTARALSTAHKYFEEIELFMPELFDKQPAANPVAEQCQNVLDLLRDGGQKHFARSDLLKKLWRHGLNAGALDLVLETLLQAELVEQFLIGSKIYYRLGK